MTEQWDVTYYDEATQTGFRVRCKRLTVRDAARVDELRDAISRRENVGNRDLLHLMNQYPLMRFATLRAEMAVLEERPEADEDNAPQFAEGTEWESFELTEDRFQDLSEWFMWAWYSMAVQHNPHRSQSYEMLKKNLETVLQQSESAANTSDNAPSENVVEPISSGG